MDSAINRREFLATAGAASVGWGLAGVTHPRVSWAQDPGQRPIGAPQGVRVLNPRARVPVSLIIDDSTCLVNLAHFCIPQFAEVFPANYRQDWRSLPREIPDAFVREFAEWCEGHGVKGKYSVVPYPACVGWLDRDIPGWTRKELAESLNLLRTDLASHWDFHPEMITHTWAINTKTGRPYPERTEKFQENWGFSVGKSVDELTDYLAFALRILKNAGLNCEGVTTPGGFGTRVLPELAQATLHSCRDVFATEIPHYFRHLYTDDRSVAPRVEFASGLDGDDPRCVVSMIGCTGDWFGGWDGLEAGRVDQFITEDLKGGRLPQVIARGEPAILVCHWPGIYFNGQKIGFQIFQEVVKRLHAAHDHLAWMKLSEIARYWAAKELTKIEAVEGGGYALRAPFAAQGFTLEINTRQPLAAPPRFETPTGVQPLREVSGRLKLESGTWCRERDMLLLCVDLPRGVSRVSPTS